MPESGALEPIAQASVVIDAPRARIWDALTVPELMREYFFGATVSTDWQPGGSITFTGEWNGKPYQDKGEILTFQPQDELSYSHWSHLNGAADAPENYHVITIRLSESVGGTTVSLVQSNLTGGIKESDRTNRGEYEAAWKAMLEGLKKTVEIDA